MKWAESRMDQLTDTLEQTFSLCTRENISTTVKRVVEDVIDVASNNINEVLYR